MLSKLLNTEKNAMQILQIINKLSVGGGQRLVIELSNQLSKFHNVTILTLFDLEQNDLFSDQLAPAVETESLGKHLGFDWKIVAKLYRAIKKIEPDVIHNHMRSFNYLTPVIPFLNDIPIIHTVHSDAFKESPFIIRQIRKQLFKQKNIVPVTISDVSGGSFEKAYSNIDHTLIYNGRSYPEQSEQFDKVLNEINEYKVDNQTKVFINIGRVAPSKNQLMLIEAFNRLMEEEQANAVLIIIGGVRNDEECLKIHHQLKREEKKHSYIHILGNRLNVTDYLHLGDFFCLSSLFEGMPFTLIEAFAAGCIPVCTPVGGIPEMVKPLESSLLSKSINVDDYYWTLKKAYAMPSKKQQALKEQAKQLFDKNYSIEHCAGRYLKLYKRLIE